MFSYLNIYLFMIYPYKTVSSVSTLSEPVFFSNSRTGTSMSYTLNKNLLNGRMKGYLGKAWLEEFSP